MNDIEVRQGVEKRNEAFAGWNGPIPGVEVRGDQERPKTTPRGPKSDRRAAKSRQERPRAPKSGPRPPQEVPRATQEPPRAAPGKRTSIGLEARAMTLFQREGSNAMFHTVPMQVILAALALTGGSLVASKRGTRRRIQHGADACGSGLRRGV